MFELMLGFFAVGVFALLVVPALLLLAAVGLVLKLAFFLVLLPFQILFLGLAGLFHAAGALVKMVAGFVLFVLAGTLALVLLLVPAIPVAGVLILAAGLAWVMTRLVRRPRRSEARA